MADFLQFVTFRRYVTSNMASGCIKLSCVDSKSVFASTCLIDGAENFYKF